jgi:hypothetical protein
VDLRTESGPRSPSERFENPELANAHRCVPRSSLAVGWPLGDFPCVLAPHWFGAPTLRFWPLRGLQTQGTVRLTGQ